MDLAVGLCVRIKSAARVACASGRLVLYIVTEVCTLFLWFLHNVLPRAWRRGAVDDVVVGGRWAVFWVVLFDVVTS